MPSADRELIELIRTTLAAAADPERAAIQQAYMKSAMPYFGIGSPELKVLLRPLFAAYRPADRGAWESTIRELWDGATHREERYAAIALARHRVGRAWQDPGMLDLYRHLIVTGAWWDLVDEIASHLVGDVLASHRESGDPGRQAVGGRRRPVATAYGGHLPAPARGRHGPRPLAVCDRRQRRRTPRSGCARQSAGRCASRRRPTRSGSAPRWTGWTAESRDCPDGRRSSTSESRGLAPKSRLIFDSWVSHARSRWW